jgi:chromosome segregation ATPase
MKKTQYLTILSVAIALVFGANLALAQTQSTDASKPSLWNRIFGGDNQKQEEQKVKMEERKAKLDEERAKMEERRLKMASTTNRIEDRLENRMEKRASTTAKIEDRIKNREDRIASTTMRIEERREKRASGTEARRERLEEKFKTGVSNRIAQVNDRLGDAIERLTNTDTRIKAHIAKLKAKNVDTTNAEALLVTAEGKLTVATEKIATLKTSLESVLATNISTSTKNTIKSKTEEANIAVKATHQAFVNVIESLKPGRNGNEAGATTTASTTTQ